MHAQVITGNSLLKSFMSNAHLRFNFAYDITNGIYVLF